MCFTCIGDLSKMTADTIIKVRKCPRLEYAIAYWIWNNHNDEYEKMGLWNEETSWYKNEHLKLLDPDWSWVAEAIYEITNDDAYDNACEECYETDCECEHCGECCVCGECECEEDTEEEDDPTEHRQREYEAYVYVWNEHKHYKGVHPLMTIDQWWENRLKLITNSSSAITDDPVPTSRDLQ